MKKISIYLVEDYFLARISYKYALEKFQELELIGDFEGANECICAMEKRQADVVLMDLGLEDMNGIEATKIIKEKYPDTKVVILTSHENDSEVRACIASGASCYVIKDIKTETLVEIIKTASFGAYWYHPQIEKIPFSLIPKPESYELDKLYPDREEIKKILTPRELQVLELLVDGKSNIEIADEISISAHTAKAHVGAILEKLKVDDRVQAAVKAVRSQLF